MCRPSSSEFPGMTCGHCEAAVKSEVSKVPGVASVDGRPRDQGSGGRRATRSTANCDLGRRRRGGVRGRAVNAPAPGRSEIDPAVIDLAVTGMTCAACAMRIEKKLNRLEGVSRVGELCDGEGPRRVRPDASTDPEGLVAVGRGRRATELGCPRPPVARGSRRSRCRDVHRSFRGPTRSICSTG